jgi:flagellar biosynthesis GTPase FlhF
MLKKFIGKTIEAAKMSAKQMYEDDFVILDSTPEKGGKEAGITVMVDQKKKVQSSEKKPSPAFNKRSDSTPEGVRFERSDSNGASPNLQRLRSLARSNFGREFGRAYKGEEEKNTAGTEKRTAADQKPAGIANEKNNPQRMYRRSSVRTPVSTKPENSDSALPLNGNGEASKNGGSYSTTGSDELLTPERSLLRRFEESKPKIAVPGAAGTSSNRQGEREIAALHKRFDKLEALLDSALISSNLEYASHPAFQQLVQAGIGTSTVAGWFSDIIRQGVDPFDQGDLFMAKLSGIIRDTLKGAAAGPAVKNLLFTGPSGSGKTSLIMKLLLSPNFYSGKDVAVVSLKPQGDDADSYYTILEPFCKDHDIPFFCVSSGVEITRYKDAWEAFDHILFDSPSLSVANSSSFREYWKIRQLLASVTPLEVHYVVNASMNRFYFSSSSSLHHPLQPDFVAITHLDEADQWGPVIPFLKEMGCAARYVSSGRNIRGSIAEFEPAWFTRKVLQES